MAPTAKTKNDTKENDGKKISGIPFLSSYHRTKYRFTSKYSNINKPIGAEPQKNLVHGTITLCQFMEQLELCEKKK